MRSILAIAIFLIIVMTSKVRASSRFDAASSRFKIRESLLRAIAHVESNFDAHAIGRNGEVGMFQMKKISFIDVQRRYGLQGTFPDALFNEQTAALFAAAYLALLREQGFNTDFDLLRAYNQGPTGARAGKGTEYANRVLETERRYYA